MDAQIDRSIDRCICKVMHGCGTVCMLVDKGLHARVRCHAYTHTVSLFIDILSLVHMHGVYIYIYMCVRIYIYI